MALFHAAMTANKSPRQLKMLADHAVDRVQKGCATLHYDHHFNPGDEANKLFWSEHPKAVEPLSQGNIRIA